MISVGNSGYFHYRTKEPTNQWFSSVVYGLSYESYGSGALKRLAS